MTTIRPPIRAPRKVPGSPLPAARNAREDRGQRKLETKRVSGLSDGFPAGRTPIVSSETPRRAWTAASPSPKVRVTARAERAIAVVGIVVGNGGIWIPASLLGVGSLCLARVWGGFAPAT